MRDKVVISSSQEYFLTLAIKTPVLSLNLKEKTSNLLNARKQFQAQLNRQILDLDIDKTNSKKLLNSPNLRAEESLTIVPENLTL